MLANGAKFVPLLMNVVKAAVELGKTPIEVNN